MKKTIIKQVELYSNSIVTFIVLQSLAYAYNYGTNKSFNCHINTDGILAEILIGMFLLTTLCASVAVNRIGKMKVELIQDHAVIICKVTNGKLATVIFFGLFPAVLTFLYAILLADNPGYCTS